MYRIRFHNPNSRLVKSWWSRKGYATREEADAAARKQARRSNGHTVTYEVIAIADLSAPTVLHPDH